MKFVDRIKEQEALRTALEAKASNFIVIYGRRRLGKSTLIRRVLKSGDITGGVTVLHKRANPFDFEG